MESSKGVERLRVGCDVALDPHDRLLASVVRQAILDLHTGPTSERQASQEYLAQLGLLDDTGEVVRADVADVGMVWVGVE